MVRTLIKRVAKKTLFPTYKRAAFGSEWRRYKSQTRSLRLNLGCGGNIIPGWFNTDLYPGLGVSYLDFSKPMPFADSTFDAVMCEHTIEHIPKALAVYMCREAHRTLKTGGSLRIVTPSLDHASAYIVQPESPDALRFLELNRMIGKSPNLTLSDCVNNLFYCHGHQYLFSRAELHGILRSLGFSEIHDCGALVNHDPIFAGADGHSAVIGTELNRLESFAIEAVK